MSEAAGLPADRLRRLRTLTEVSRTLTYATSIDEVLEVTVGRAVELMDAEKVLLMLADADGLLTVRASHGLDEDQVRHLREPLMETLIRRLQELLGYPSAECFLSVPLVSQGRVTGLLAAVRPLDARSGPDDEWLLSALGDQAAVALENARLVEMVAAERGEADRKRRAEGRTHAMLGHELRSPLLAIQSYSSLLLEGPLGPLNERQRESIARIRMSGRHVLSIIEEVLEAARLKTGGLELATTELWIREVLTEALDIVRPRGAERNQTLRMTCPEDVLVRGDAARLRQALVNLIGNAVQYSPDGGTIEVAVGTEERAGALFAAIAVRDEGPGIPPDALDRIFRPYERGEAGPEGGGLGLGLFISREVVTRMGGEIHVTSEVGSGSTFTVLLPLVREAGSESW